MSKTTGLPLLLLIIFLTGCAEGPLWQTGSLAPWVRAKWTAEEQLADTYFSRQRELNELVTAAQTTDLKNAAAVKLGEIIQKDPVLLLRLHAVELLGQIPTRESAKSLGIASKDPDSTIRSAAARSLKMLPDELAVPILQEINGSDTDVDVRLAATKSLASFNSAAAIDALSIALTDTNPAIQYSATQSLGKITGQDIGADVVEWQNYLSNITTQRTALNLPQTDIR